MSERAGTVSACFRLDVTPVGGMNTSLVKRTCDYCVVAYRLERLPMRHHFVRQSSSGSDGQSMWIGWPVAFPDEWHVLPSGGAAG